MAEYGARGAMVALLVLLLVAATAAQPIGGYSRSQRLSAVGNLTVFWRVNTTAQPPRIFLALQSTATGFMAFGLGEPTSGSMPGADILVAGINSLGAAYVEDRYAVAKTTPLLDAGQDWQLLSGGRVNGVTTIHASRLLDTGNIFEDRPFLSGPVRVIWSQGLTGNSFTYHDVNRGATQISFYGADFVDASSVGGVSETYLVNRFTIPAQKKTYACKSFELYDMVTTRHGIAFEPVLAAASEKYVHHITFHSCSNTTWFNKYKASAGQCESPVGNPTSGCMEVFWMWAIGAGSFVLPNDAGVRFGAGGIQRIVMQFHYDNPSLDSGVVDSSGFRVWSTTTLRAHDSGTMIVGDPFTTGGDAGGNIPALTSSYETEFSCNGQCTQSLRTPVTIFASCLHMHGYGKQMWTSVHNSSGLVTRLTNKIEYWDFGFQQFTSIEPFVINKGDRLNTHCIYDTSASSADVTFGTDSSQEMCMEFLMYYPRLPSMSYCGAAASYSVCGESLGLPTPNVGYPDASGQEVRVFGNPTEVSAASTASSTVTGSGSSPTSRGSSSARGSTGRHVSHAARCTPWMAASATTLLALLFATL